MDNFELEEKRAEDLKAFVDDVKEHGCIVRLLDDGAVEILVYGYAIILLQNGYWYLEGTDGG